MNILIVNNMAPFIWGGAEELAVNLKKYLILGGHRAEILRIPFKYDPASCIPSQMLMARAFELWNVDRVIALKFPAYLIRHPHKTLWILHQYRQAYDLYDNGHSNISMDIKGEELRRVIKNADEQTFHESKKIYTISKVTQQRLSRYNHFSAEVLSPPLNDEELFIGGSSDGYIFAGGRISRMKRQYLLLEALKFTPPQVKLIIAGPPDSPQDAQHLEQLVESYGLASRVKLDFRFLPRLELAEYVNHALACACLPYDEDRGYVSVEAVAAGKALITTTDSGGVLEVVKNRLTGWIAEPDPKAIADVLTEATLNPTLTRSFGIAGQQSWQSMKITWPHTVMRLLK